MDSIRLFVAGKVFIRHNGKILILQESPNYEEGTNAGKFDVVGGRLVPGESLEESIKREVSEETGLSISVGRPFFVNESRPTVNGEKWQIIRIFFSAEADTDKVMLSSEHENSEWIDPINYKEYPIIENLNPAFDEYIKQQ